MRATRALFIFCAALLLTTLAPTRTAAQRPDSLFLEDLTWTEVRDAVAKGTNVVIIPIGGMEQNGPHMVVGKHNFVVKFAANLMARRLGNALVAPVVNYDPQGSADSGNFRDQPGKITAATVYEKVLEFSARSLKVHGFKDILFIGDSGSNQRGMTVVADLLNREWEASGARLFPITAYYSVGREHYRAYLLAQHGWDDETVGSHAGISDTSQMLYVRPEGIRKDKLMPRGGGPNSGVSGDPTKASAEIGKMGIEFKVNAAIAQYRQLKTPRR